MDTLITEKYLKSIGAIEHKVPGCVSEWKLFHDNFELNWDLNSGLVIFIEYSDESIYLPHIKTCKELTILFQLMTNKKLIV